jgi:hypothetical protein
MGKRACGVCAFAELLAIPRVKRVIRRQAVQREFLSKAEQCIKGPEWFRCAYVGASSVHERWAIRQSLLFAEANRRHGGGLLLW